MADSHPLIGRTLEGRFRLTGYIGEGAMATVLRGVDLAQNNTDVAVKVMHPHLAEDRTFAGRFRREAQAAAMLRHPNTVNIVHFGEDERMHFIVMELVRGRDLREVLKTEKRLPEVRAATIVIAVCEALEAAHKIGIVHRDLKPENIMVLEATQPGQKEIVKVLDFGIAKLVDNAPKQPRESGDPDSEPPPALTQVGVVVGTPAYMSPEQCRGQPLDGRSDLYTCGILLYQLTTGRVPFESESPFEVAGKQAFEAPPPPTKYFSSMFPQLEQLILSLLAKSPAERPQTATELKDALTKIIGQLSGRGSKTIPMTSAKPMVDAAEIIRQAEALRMGAPPGTVGVRPSAQQSQSPGQPQAWNDPQRQQQPMFGQQPGGFGQQQQQQQQQPWRDGASGQSFAGQMPQAPHGFQQPPQQQPPPAFGQQPQQQRPPDGASPQTAQPQQNAPSGQGGYPAAPGADARPAKKKKKGVGGVVTFLFVLIAMGAGVGLGYTLFLYVKF
jgi:serine/threonine protein kinase